VSPRDVVVSASAYATCRPAADGRDWQDYTARLAVSGVSGEATALVTVRTADDSWAEVAVSDRRYTVRQRVGGRWHVFTTGTLPKAAIAPRHVLTLDVAGRRLRVAIDGVALPPATLDSTLAHGAIGVGLAPRGSHTVTFTPLTVVAHAPAPVPPGPRGPIG
jgi:hypothetical protein